MNPYVNQLIEGRLGFLEMEEQEVKDTITLMKQRLTKQEEKLKEIQKEKKELQKI